MARRTLPPWSCFICLLTERSRASVVAIQHTYWIATTDARERSVKRQMKQLHGGSVRLAIEDQVRLTGHCRNTEERLAILEPYLEERLAERFTPAGTHVAGASL